mmetsp:Transcript_32180/g.76404  ORF Transcript_32180/g.76404 Transcript_32180/m.76404 type:complete len:359 (-) Transcript_32180:4648-5724(-)
MLFLLLHGPQPGADSVRGAGHAVRYRRCHVRRHDRLRPDRPLRGAGAQGRDRDRGHEHVLRVRDCRVACVRGIRPFHIDRDAGVRHAGIAGGRENDNRHAQGQVLLPRAHGDAAVPVLQSDLGAGRGDDHAYLDPQERDGRVLPDADQLPAAVDDGHGAGVHEGHFYHGHADGDFSDEDHLIDARRDQGHDDHHRRQGRCHGPDARSVLPTARHRPRGGADSARERGPGAGDGDVTPDEGRRGRAGNHPGALPVRDSGGGDGVSDDAGHQRGRRAHGDGVASVRGRDVCLVRLHVRCRVLPAPDVQPGRVGVGRGQDDQGVLSCGGLRDPVVRHDGVHVPVGGGVLRGERGPLLGLQR